MGTNKDENNKNNTPDQGPDQPNIKLLPRRNMMFNKQS